MKFKTAFLLFFSLCCYQVDAALDPDDAQLLASLTLQQKQLLDNLRKNARAEGRLYAHKIAMVLGFGGLALVNGIEWYYKHPQDEAGQPTAQPLLVQDEAPSP